MIYKLSIILLFLTYFFLPGCNNPLPEEKKINGKYTLLSQDSSKIILPEHFNEKILLTGFIFTNCPDICPMTIHNLQLIQKRIKKEKIDNVEFAAVSFDPLRDTPSVLKKQAELREVDLSNFHFLTGSKSEINLLLDEMNISAFAGDTTFTETGEPVYFFVHTDRITLIDMSGKIRKEYRGSKINIEDIVSDIKYLGE